MTNIAKILKNAPKGLKLYSPIFGKCTLLRVKKDEIEIHKCEGNPPYYFYYLDNAGIYHPDGECVLFPSKEHKSWDNWQEVLFQRGDVIRATDGEILLFNSTDYAFTNKAESIIITKDIYRYATPEERKQFFKELNDNGYYWNENTKQMGKSPLTNTPKYKVGDWIKRLTPDNKEKKYFLLKVTEINDVSYQLENIYGNRYYKEKTFVEDEKYWEIATEQELIDAGIKEKPFTIDDLKPTQFVLVRDWNDQEWWLDIYSRKDENDNYSCISGTWDKCIPYNDETKHLLGTTDDCPKKYKTW